MHAGNTVRRLGAARSAVSPACSVLVHALCSAKRPAHVLHQSAQRAALLPGPSEGWKAGAAGCSIPAHQHPVALHSGSHSALVCRAHRNSRRRRRRDEESSDDEDSDYTSSDEDSDDERVVAMQRTSKAAAHAVRDFAGHAVRGFTAVSGIMVLCSTMATVLAGVAAFAICSSVLWPMLTLVPFVSVLFFPFGLLAGLAMVSSLPSTLCAMWTGLYASIVRDMLLPTIATVGGIALGIMLIRRMFISISTSTSRSRSSRSGSSRSERGARRIRARRPGIDDGPVVQASSRSLNPEEVEALRISNELRDFDRMMADRAAQERMDEWRKAQWSGNQA